MIDPHGHDVLRFDVREGAGWQDAIDEVTAERLGARGWRRSRGP